MAHVSEFRLMWLIVMFDLPTQRKLDRKRYSVFRKVLLDDGFWLMQYSVYLRPCASRDIAARHAAHVARNLPVKGAVRILELTDAQYSRARCFRNLVSVPVEQQPSQMQFF